MSVPVRALSVIALLAVHGCTGSEAPPATDGASAPPAPVPAAQGPRDTLIIGVMSGLGNAISVVSETSFDSNVESMVSFPLVDAEFDCSLKKLPGIAKSWEWSDDGTILSMELRDDVKWEDGKPVTVDDIAFTMELVADPAVASPRVSNIERLKPDGRPKVIDPTHIEWHFTQAYDRDTQMAHATSLPLLPKHIFGTLDRETLRGSERASHPVSYGPWRVAQWEPGQQLVMEPNPAFTGPAEYRPRLNRVIFRIIPEYATRLLELESGNTDLMEAVLVSDADRLRETHPEIRLVRRGWRSSDYIAWNLTDPKLPFGDLKVRRAMAMATDVDSMIAKVLTSKTGESYARRAIGTITPALCGVHNDDVAPIPYEVQKAKELLAEAGWQDTNNDGIVDKGGKKFSFVLMTNAGNKRRADAAVLFQDQMKQVGIEVNLEKVESNAFFERTRKKDYQAALSGWSAGLFVDPSVIWHCDTPQKKYEFNFTGYCNPEVDKLIEQGLATPNPKDSAPIWKDMQAKIYADQPYLFLWWMDEIVAVHNRFENTTIDVLSPYNRLEEWEVPPDKVKYPN